MKTKLLVINYYWPPCGGPAVQRWLNFTRYLPESGVQPYVLTVDPETAAFPAWDESLLKQVSPEVQVFRTETRGVFDFYKKTLGKGQIPSTNLANEPSPSFLQKIARFVRGNFFLPDPRKGWNRFALPEARRLIREEEIEVIATAGPPHSTHLIGRQLKRELPHLRWIADLHDYWTDSSYVHQFYRTWLAHQMDLRYELSVLREADHILTAYQMGSDRVAVKVKNLRPRSDFTGISMGYDTELFTARESLPQQEFRITFTGTMTANFDPSSFFQVLQYLRKKSPELPLKLCFVGWLSEEVRGLLERYQLSEVLETPGYVSHQEAIDYLYRSTVLFLITPKFSGEKYHVPGKLYEYLATEKPIFCISPHESETAQIIRECQAGQNFERSQEKQMLQTLEKWIKKWKQEKSLDLKNTEKPFVRYARDEETKVLAKIVLQT